MKWEEMKKKSLLDETPAAVGNLLSIFCLSNAMYPAVFGRVAKLGSNSMRCANVLLRKSMFLHSTISAHMISRRAISTMEMVKTTTKRVMSFAAQPKPTNPWGGSSPAETAALFIGISSIICGGIYYLSYSTKVSLQDFVDPLSVEISRVCKGSGNTQWLSRSLGFDECCKPSHQPRPRTNEERKE